VRGTDPRTSARQQDEAVIELLRRHALRLANSFDLPLRALQAESRRVRSRYGACYSDGTIKIRLRSLRNGELLRESSLVDTLCHELAHLRHFDHSVRFERLYRRILEYARRHAIYRPGQPSRWSFELEPQPAIVPLPARARSTARPALPIPERPASGPVQLELF
jgi:hypothetical protein